MRNLVTVQTIKGLDAIPDADNIVLATVLGWKCIVKKGEFKVGDKCVYFEVDSYLPIEDRYEFLRDNSYKKNLYLKPKIGRLDGFRIKTQFFRGCISQGLVLPLDTIIEGNNCEVGTDLTSILNVAKWDTPEIDCDAGIVIGDKPFCIPTTDETRVQSLDALREQLFGKPYYISTKMDGTSCTIYCNEGKVGVCGRNDEYADNKKCGMWNTVHKKELDYKLKEFGRNLALQGEYCGKGIHKDRLRLPDHDIFVFNIFDLDTRRLLNLTEMLDVCAKLGVSAVPIEETGNSFNYTLEELLEKAKGKYPSGLDKEGIVIRPIEPVFCEDLRKSLSFKVLNNDFLKKEK